MRDNSSSAGREFNTEREALFLRWERLVRVLSGYVVGGSAGPPSNLDQIDDYLKLAQLAPLVYYPKPGPLAPNHQVLQQCVEDASAETLKVLWVVWGPGYSAQDERAMSAYNRASSVVSAWGADVWRQCARVKPRTSKRTAIAKYRSEVIDFCLRWNLRAWWAVPALVDSHFMRAETGQDLLLDMYVKGVWDIVTYPIVAQLPGTGDAEFKRDWARFESMMIETTIRKDSHQPVTVRLRPKRDEMAVLEDKADAACVVVDWDGHAKYPSSVVPHPPWDS